MGEDEAQEWMWLVKTNKGDFQCTVLGHWNQEEAAKKVRAVFHVQLKLTIIDMISRKRPSGPDDIQCTIVEQIEKKDELGFHFLAGRKIWEAVGRGDDFDKEYARQLEER